MQDPTRVAVLYLDAARPDSQLAAIGRGLSRDLIDALGRIRPLTVTSDLGVRRFAGRQPELATVVRDLEVGTIVHGTLEEAGDSLFVDVRVSDAGGAQRGHVRAALPRGDLHALRDEVVRGVADELRRVIGTQVHLRGWRASTRSDSAWMLRQRALELHRSAREAFARGMEEPAWTMVTAAEGLLARAAAADPLWAEPVVARGWLSAMRALRADSAGRVRWLGAGRAFANEALRRTPHDAAALELRGAVAFQLWRLVYHGRDDALADSALRDLSTATARDPRRARAWNYLGALLAARGDAEGASAAARAALEADAWLDEVAPSIQQLAMSHLHAAQFDSARALCREGARRFPESTELRFCEITVLGWSGRGRDDLARLRGLVEALVASGGVPTVGGRWTTGRAFEAAVLARDGDRAQALAVLDSVRASFGGAPPSDWLPLEAMVRTLLRQRAEALTLLEEVVRQSPQRAAWIASVPWYAPLRDEPRYRRLVGSRD